MIPAIRSEFRKFFTTRLWWGMAVGIFLAGAAFAARAAAGLLCFRIRTVPTP